jgi:glycosyltransferase involved in cell wall biosynthesis
LRILVVSQYFWPENFRINDLVKEWLQRGHQVTVLTGIPNYPAGKIFEAYREQPSAFSEYEGAEVVRVPMFPRGSGNVRLMLNYLSFVLSAWSFGPWRLRGKPADVIFVFQLSPMTVGLPAVWLGKIKKVPVVLWVLDLWPETLAGIGLVRSPRVLGWFGHMARFIYNRCTLVLGQSRGFLGSIAQYCDDKAKISYLPNWAEDVFTDDSVQMAPEVSGWSDGFTVVFAGNIGEAQDMPAVLDAAERLRDNAKIRWIIVGDGRQSGWLQSEVTRRGLHTQILLPGRFPLERMPSFYAHADALLVSLKRNSVFSLTIPGKVQSYLTAGIPLLGMLNGEGAAVIREANAGFTCDAGDGKGLAQAVLTLTSMSPEKRKQMGLNGRRYAEQEFGRTHLIDRLETLLCEAVSSRETKALKTRKFFW